MKNTIFVFAFLVSAFYSPLWARKGSDAVETGKLPAVISAALKVIPVEDAVTPDQLVITNDPVGTFYKQQRKLLEAYAVGQGVSTPEELPADFLQKYKSEIDKMAAEIPTAAGFTVGHQFPIFINAQSPTFAQAEADFARGVSQWSRWYAAIIAHEHIHAIGEKDELPAYRRQLKLLRQYQAANELRGMELGVQNVQAIVLKLESEKNSILLAGAKP